MSSFTILLQFFTKHRSQYKYIYDLASWLFTSHFMLSGGGGEGKGEEDPYPENGSKSRRDTHSKKLWQFLRDYPQDWKVFAQR